MTIPGNLSDSAHRRRRHLIVGGCGFIGRHVALVLAKAGDAVVIADRVPLLAPFPDEVRGRISFVELDLRSADWDRLLEGVETVHHYAWPSIPATAQLDPAADLAASVVPTIALLQAIARLDRERPRLVFSSSGGTVYGRLHQVPVPETHPIAPITAYGAGKAAAELYIDLFRSTHGLDCRIARISNPFGAGQDLARGQGAASVFLARALSNEPITVWGDGEVVRDYIHISDAAAGLVALARLPASEGNATFNIGSGEGVSLNGIIAELGRQLGRPVAVTREAGRPFDVPVSVLDITRTCAMLHWSPRLTFADGVARTLADLERGAALSSLH